MKKISTLVLATVLSLSVVGCGKYEDKCNPEYYMIGHALLNSDIYEGLSFNEKVEETLLYVNEGNNINVNINNVGDVFKFNGEVYEYTIDEFKFSKDNNDDGQFSDAQLGLIHGMNNEISKEGEDFIEYFKDEDGNVKYISQDLYDDMKEMYNEYLSTTSDIVDEYKGELNEEQLNEIKYLNRRYEHLHEELAEEVSETFMENIFEGLFY